MKIIKVLGSKMFSNMFIQLFLLSLFLLHKNNVVILINYFFNLKNTCMTFKLNKIYIKH